MRSIHDSGPPRLLPSAVANTAHRDAAEKLGHEILACQMDDAMSDDQREGAYSRTHRLSDAAYEHDSAPLHKNALGIVRVPDGYQFTKASIPPGTRVIQVQLTPQQAVVREIYTRTRPHFLDWAYYTVLAILAVSAACGLLVTPCPAPYSARR